MRLGRGIIHIMMHSIQPNMDHKKAKGYLSIELFFLENDNMLCDQILSSTFMNNSRKYHTPSIALYSCVDICSAQLEMLLTGLWYMV